jgi:8-oxo-dGTP pyrophosphatase MutT (NUDIX family)
MQLLIIEDKEYLMPQFEEVVIVDKENNIIRSAPRYIMRRDGLIHRATYILVFNSAGELFIHKRTFIKDIFPGFYDLCVGGVVVAGENYEVSAARELEEEIGVSGVLLKAHFDFYGEYENQKVWGRVFSCISEGPFTLQVEEVIAGAFYPIDEALNLTRTKPCTPDSVYVFNRFLGNRES